MAVRPAPVRPFLRAMLLACLCAAGPMAALAADQPTDWLNVKDCGASGSTFEATATITEGSKEITLSDVGDFKVGQGVMLSRGNPHYYGQALHGPGLVYYDVKKLDGKVEIRGYDGSGGEWLGFVLDIRDANPVSFRWSDDLARSWKAQKVPITYDWQPLSGGVEVRFLKYDWQPGHIIAFGARDQFLSAIEKIEGNRVTLKDAPKHSAQGVAVRHDDRPAIQQAIDRAIKEQKNVYLPQGRYRLSKGIGVRKAAICIEGAGEHTVLDISHGQGSVFGLYGGTSVTIRNLNMVGHHGYADRSPSFSSVSGGGYWPMALQASGAIYVGGVERLLVEDVHVSKMTAECFYSGGSLRGNAAQGKAYTQSITYLRCSVSDCGFNAFNNNDLAENTNILYCRVQDIGGAFWEGPSRYLRFVGNYVRNSDGFSIGNQSKRHDDNLHQLGCGQAIVADNVLEGGRRVNGIRVAHGPTQVVIANNLFINFNGPAITVSSETWKDAYPAGNTVIKGNLIDLTCMEEKPIPRAGIEVSASDTIVADNQVYLRGANDPISTGIKIIEPVLNVSVHDNLIRNCGAGIVTGRLSAKVTQVIDPQTFLQTRLPYEWRYSHLYRGWNLAWIAGGKAASLSTIAAYDPDTLRFTLTTPHEMKPDDQFEVFPPGPANWDIHSNTITGCLRPVVLDSYGSGTSFFKDNIVSRGEATGVKQAVAVRGAFKLIGNHISGFDEQGCVALALSPDPLGRIQQNLCRGNIFERCSVVVAESSKAFLKAPITEDNVALNCGNAGGNEAK